MFSERDNSSQLFTYIRSGVRLATQLVDPSRPGDFNQAVMELGATVCSPSAPSCSTCPISDQCQALSLSRKHESVLVTNYPMKVAKAKRRHDFSAVSVVEIVEEGSQSDSSYLLVKRPDEGLLAGLWEFPSVLLEGEADLASRRKAVDRFLKQSFGLDIQKSSKVVSREEVGVYVHIFTHIRLKMYIELLILHLPGGVNFLLKEQGSTTIKWKCIDRNALSTLGLTSAVRKDDIVLIDETKVGVQQKLELWRDTLEARGFRLSRSKTEYMECRFSDNSDREAEMITFDGKVVHGSTFFRYLGSIIQKDGELDGDVAHRIKAGWLKWKSAIGVLCDPDMPHRLKGKFYRTAIRPTLLYGTECWAVKQCHVQKMNVAEMRMLRWMCGHTKKDRLRNEVIREKVRVASIEDKMMENRLRWFGHVRRRHVDAPVRRLESWGTINIVKGRGRPKKTWIKLIENDMRFLGIGESMAMERQIWKERIRVVDEI
ncbi:hypothetical protein OROGR_019727 [Orobanche gracilis]